MRYEKNLTNGCNGSLLQGKLLRQRSLICQAHHSETYYYMQHKSLPYILQN